jgi:fructuronate reductase
VSFTITEKGYSLVDSKGDFRKEYERISERSEKPDNIMGKVTALLFERFLAGGAPIAMVSMDNCSHNGDKLFAAVETYAKHWINMVYERRLLAFIMIP